MNSRAIFGVAGRAMAFLPLRVYERLMPRNVVGFCYHIVASRPRPHVHHLFRCKTPPQFERDLAFLRRRYTLVSYEQLRTRKLRPGALPDAVLTFDDGYAECHTTIRPLLKRYGVPAIFFVTTGFLDNRRLFYRNAVSLCIDAAQRFEGSAANAVLRDLEPAFGTRLPGVRDLVARLRALTLADEAMLRATCQRLWVDPEAYLKVATPYLTSTQVVELATDGFTIGAHGRDHSRMALLTPETAEREIVDSCLAITKLVGASEAPFAFPFSGRGVSRAMLRALRARHSQVGLFFDSEQMARDEDFIVNRIMVDIPPPLGYRRTNLPNHLRAAYCREMLRSSRGASTGNAASEAETALAPS